MSRRDKTLQPYLARPFFPYSFAKPLAVLWHPTAMQAIQILTTGSPDVLTLCDLPTPTPAPGEALIRIEASGVNFIDTYFRDGRYTVPLPYTLGQEAAGTVLAVADDVTGVKAGDRVAWCSIPGTYAQLAVAPANRLVLIPEGVTSQQAAGALLQGMTAHYLSHSTYPIQSGDEVLIHAGAGGTGLLLIQMAKARGARVFTTVSTEEKAALARAAGADEIIFYTQEDFAAKVKTLTSGKGIPVVYDSVGKSTFEQSLQCLRPRGLLVLFGGASGAVPPFDLIRLSTMGSLFVTRPTLKDYIASRADLEARAKDVFDTVADGTLKLRLEHTYPLADAAHAHRDLESRSTTGKLLLIP
jgi:NADPH2:quinone reductase